jgi:phospholipid-transporting ATPase
MSSDFERLVSSANPAAARTQQGASGSSQPPRRSLDHANPFLIDDFDEYDDTPRTDPRLQNRQDYPAGSSAAAYGNQRSHAMSNPLDEPIDLYEQPQPLARGPSTTSKRSIHGTGQPQGWIFDADDHSNNPSTLNVNGNGTPFDGSKLFNGTLNESSEGLRVGSRKRKGALFSFKKTWKWPWEREKVLVGERLIFLNDERANADSSFVNNYVSTSKYNVVSFLPKFLYGQYDNKGMLLHEAHYACRAILQICQYILPFHR